MHHKDTDRGNKEHTGDFIDDELMEISKPAPGIFAVIMTFAVLVMSLLMLVWFAGDLKYLFSGSEIDADLGEAAFIDMNSLENNTYVSLTGLVWINRTLSFNVGTKWFSMSDMSREFSPLIGRPGIFVQWAIPDKNKAYRDPRIHPSAPGLPTRFTGRLLEAEQLGGKYNRIFVFFDCLRAHQTSQCKKCLGLNSLNDCRQIIACTERNTPEVCAQITKLKDIESNGSKSSNKENSTNPSRDMDDLVHEREQISLEVRAMRFESVLKRAQILQKAAGKIKIDKKALFGFLKNLNQMRFDYLSIRGKPAVNIVHDLNEKEIEKLKALTEEKSDLEQKLKTLDKDLPAVKSLLNVGTMVNSFLKRILNARENISLLDKEDMSGLTQVMKTYQKNADKDFSSSLGSVEEIIMARKKVLWSKSGDAGVYDDLKEEIQKKAPTFSQTRYFIGLFDEQEIRLRNILDKFKFLNLENGKEIINLDMTRDIFGNAPKSLKARKIASSLNVLEKILKNIPMPETDNPAISLRARLKKLKKDQEIFKKKKKALEAQKGLGEYATYKILKKANPSSQKLVDFQDLTKITTLLNKAESALKLNSFYIYDLGTVPRAALSADKLLGESKIIQIEKRIDELTPLHMKKKWVLIGKSIPFDMLWIILIYLIFSTIAVLNVIKLKRFLTALK